MFFDTHNHCQFSFDGGGTTVEKSVKAAVDKGLGGICFTDHCDYFVPKMKEEFEPIVCEVFSVEDQQKEIDRVAAMVAEGAFGRAAAKKFRVSTRSPHRSTILKTLILISGHITKARTGKRLMDVTLRHF